MMLFVVFTNSKRSSEAFRKAKRKEDKMLQTGLINPRDDTRARIDWLFFVCSYSNTPKIPKIYVQEFFLLSP